MGDIMSSACVCESKIGQAEDPAGVNQAVGWL